MSPWRRGPRPLGATLATLADELAPDTPLAQLQRVWAGAVGEQIAAQAQPSAERAGVVTVSCSASVWAQELDLMAPQLIERLNAALGGARVHRLRCVATGYER